MLCGLPGSGKTRLARELAEGLPAISLDLDSWALSLLGQTPPPAQLHDLLLRLKDLHWSTARQLLAQGTNVVLDFGFWKRAERLEFARRARESGARPVLYFLDPPEEVLRSRLADRNRNLPPATYEITLEMLEVLMPRFERPDAGEGIEMKLI
ncbi:MAG TPA: ATP-binding protein [Trueperaceae bacterium]